jgi:hypothetical protein
MRCIVVYSCQRHIGQRFPSLLEQDGLALGEEILNPAGLCLEAGLSISMCRVGASVAAPLVMKAHDDDEGEVSGAQLQYPGWVRCSPRPPIEWQMFVEANEEFKAR